MALANPTNRPRFDADFLDAVLSGLRQDRKILPARFFYDERGSELFEEITRLPEYYPTRTEIGILDERCGRIGTLVGEGRVVVEFGSGSSTKTPLLLRCVQPAAYVPIDISREFLAESARALASAHPGLDVIPVAADFMRPIELPEAVRGLPMLGFFPGSTIGNLAPGAAIDLLRSFASTLGPDARLVIGFDLRKSGDILEPAYDDAAGVTAAFNLNLLERINRELDGTIRIETFRHRAVWNEALGRVEMHLVAVRDITFEIAGHRFAMKAGETIHTENSYKYGDVEISLLARASGWDPVERWHDPEQKFAVHLWTLASGASEP